MKKSMIVVLIGMLIVGCEGSRSDIEKPHAPASCDKTRALDHWCDESSHGYFCPRDSAEMAESTCMLMPLSPEIGPWVTYCCY